MSEKLTRKELRAPDAFQKAGAGFREWLQENHKRVAIAFLAVVLGGAAMAIVGYFVGRGERKSSQELGAALKILARPVEETPPPEADPENEPPFKSEADKYEAATKAMADVRKRLGAGRAAAVASLVQGESSLRLGRYDEALKAYEEFLQATQAEEPLRAIALEGAGYAHEGKGQLDQALSAFDRLSKESTTEFMNGMGLFHRARVLALQNHKEDAAKVFSEIPTAAPGSAAARMASERLQALEAQGVKVPEAPRLGTDAG